MDDQRLFTVDWLEDVAFIPNLCEAREDGQQVHIWNVARTDWVKYHMDEFIHVPAGMPTIIMRLRAADELTNLGAEIEGLSTILEKRDLTDTVIRRGRDRSKFAQRNAKHPRSLVSEVEEPGPSQPRGERSHTRAKKPRCVVSPSSSVKFVDAALGSCSNDREISARLSQATDDKGFIDVDLL